MLPYDGIRVSTGAGSDTGGPSTPCEVVRAALTPAGELRIEAAVAGLEAASVEAVIPPEAIVEAFRRLLAARGVVQVPVRAETLITGLRAALEDENCWP